MQVVALLATRNEARFIEGCIRHLNANGVEVYVLDNDSIDGTADIARQYLGHGVQAIERIPYRGFFMLDTILHRKEQLSAQLSADWVMHVDADEIHVARPSNLTLAQAFTRVEAEGYNAVNFVEYTFVPVKEYPDHDHERFSETMQWYYPFVPHFPHRVNAWKKDTRVELRWSAGHEARFPGRRLHPLSLSMKHYILLSVSHAREKYLSRRYSPVALARGWHGGRRGWRNRMQRVELTLPSAAELRQYVGDDLLDETDARTAHVFAGRFY